MKKFTDGDIHRLRERANQHKAEESEKWKKLIRKFEMIKVNADSTENHWKNEVSREKQELKFECERIKELMKIKVAEQDEMRTKFEKSSAIADTISRLRVEVIQEKQARRLESEKFEELIKETRENCESKIRGLVVMLLLLVVLIVFSLFINQFSIYFMIQ